MLGFSVFLHASPIDFNAAGTRVCHQRKEMGEVNHLPSVYVPHVNRTDEPVTKSFPSLSQLFSPINMQPGGPNETVKLWSGNPNKTVFMTLLWELILKPVSMLSCRSSLDHWLGLYLCCTVHQHVYVYFTRGDHKQTSEHLCHWLKIRLFILFFVFFKISYPLLPILTVILYIL